MTKKNNVSQELDSKEAELDFEEKVNEEELTLEDEEVVAEGEKEISPEEEISSLKLKLEALEEEVEIQKNKFLKAHADLENTKRRLTNDFAKRSKYMIQDFALNLLPALDNMDKVLLETDDKDNPLLEAVEMLQRQIKSSLKSEGVEEIKALGEKFDSNFHHAIMLDEQSGLEPDIVVEELQKGYKIKDRVLRAAMVKVSK